MKKECIAMLLAGGQGSRLYVLTGDMAKPAVPFGGKYRIIDFPLSNCTNSGIDTVGVLTQYRPLEFLLCVERTFQELRAHVERDMAHLSGEDTAAAVKDFFMIRERFFQLHPQQKLVFESAMLRPPKHLAAQIQALRAPMRRLNQEFIEGLIDKMPLRPDLKPEMVTRYLETIESLFQNMIVSYQGGHPAQDFHAMLETAGELLNMVLFGILRHADPA